MAKHTPGKWQRIGENGYKIISDLPGITARIAKIDFKDTPLNEAEANATLIAAAPELLAALQKIANWELPESGHKWNTGETMSYEAAFGTDGARDYIKSIAQQAITAAKGE